MKNLQFFPFINKDHDNNKFSNSLEYYENNSSDDDIPFIVPSRRIIIEWPNIDDIEKSDIDINIQELNSDIISNTDDKKYNIMKELKIDSFYTVDIIKLRAIRINLLPGFVKSYFFHNNIIEFNMKILSDKKFFKEIKIQSEIEKNKIYNHIFEKKFKFNLKEYSIQIFRILNLKIPLNVNIKIYFSNSNIECGLSEIVLCKKNVEILYKSGGAEIIKEIKPLNIINNEYILNIGYIQLFVQK